MHARHRSACWLAVLLLGPGAWAGGQAEASRSQQTPAAVVLEGTVVGHSARSVLVRDASGLVIPLGVDEDTRLVGAQSPEEVPVGGQVVATVLPQLGGNRLQELRVGGAEGVGGSGLPAEATVAAPVSKGQLPILRAGRGAGDIRGLGNDLGGSGTGERGF